LRSPPLKTCLVRIGNSRGVRLPKPLLDQAGLEDGVEIRVTRGALVIAAVTSPRAGWADAAAKFGPTGLLDAPTVTQFEIDEWAW
jgi:antitoxin MazE